MESSRSEQCRPFQEALPPCLWTSAASHSAWATQSLSLPATLEEAPPPMPHCVSWRTKTVWVHLYTHSIQPWIHSPHWMCPVWLGRMAATWRPAVCRPSLGWSVGADWTTPAVLDLNGESAVSWVPAAKLLQCHVTIRPSATLEQLMIQCWEHWDVLEVEWRSAIQW